MSFFQLILINKTKDNIIHIQQYAICAYIYIMMKRIQLCLKDNFSICNVFLRLRHCHNEYHYNYILDTFYVCHIYANLGCF